MKRPFEDRIYDSGWMGRIARWKVRWWNWLDSVIKRRFRIPKQCKECSFFWSCQEEPIPPDRYSQWCITNHYRGKELYNWLYGNHGEHEEHMGKKRGL